ncbi:MULTISPECIES: HAMP domain-containing sensor histidine kinase [unclassified Nocardia]|uniref:HAMP domain-containing sensor histidine kinase n=1 Tax=unclassified Nocardia TaxID=2637762 RepID=UPI001CE48C96|nr:MULTISPECIES: HAMP domain-containing sensor histidine kinase [unclassified Nocardia]
MMLSRIGIRSLRGRIAVYFAVAIALSLAAMAVAAYFVVAHELNSSLDIGLRSQATRITRQFAVDPDVAAISGPCRYLAAPSCVQVVAADGRIESDHSADLLPVDAGTRAVATGSRPDYFSDFTFGGYPMRMYTAQLRPGVAVQVARRSDTVDTGLRRVAAALFAAALGGTALAIGIGYVVGRRAFAPVTALTAAAERVATTRDPRQPIVVPDSTELGRLATSFNTMLGELDQALSAERESRAAQRRLVADASHELRTPLTALRANIDLLRRAPRQLDETAAALRTQAEELSGLVTDLIDLARAEDPAAAAESGEDLRLDLLVAERLAVARRHWPTIAFDAELEPVTLRGVPARLARAITNLLDNAAKFSPPGATVEVVLRERRLTVRDHGPGIPAADLPHVFDRFYRSAAARTAPGHGLGLAIVAQVAALHDATVTAASHPDGGAVFELTFPNL